jgi:hypothetical protein
MCCLPQGLLGSIAQLAAQQERLEQEQVLLDGCLTGLAAAIPTVQAVAEARVPGTPVAAADRLHCTLRPLALLSRVLGSSGGGSGGAAKLALEVCLLNGSRFPLEGSWSLLLTRTACDGSISECDSTATPAAPLPRLLPGAEWRQQCQLPLPRGDVGQLRVLLCRHGSQLGRGSSSGSDNSAASSSGGGSTVLLHSVQLDALLGLELRSRGHQRQQCHHRHHRHLPALAPGTGPVAGNAHGGSSPSSTAGVLQAKLLLQLPSSLCGRHPTAGHLLQLLLNHGLSTQQQLQHQPQTPDSRPQPVGMPREALHLLLPPRPSQQQGSEHGSGGGSSAWQCTLPAEPGNRAEPAACLAAQMLPAAARSSGAASQQLLLVSAMATGATSLLAWHGGLCRRIVLLQQAAAARHQGWQPAYAQLPGGKVLLPPATACAATAVVAGSTAELEQALLHMRRLREAALLLRQSAEQCAGKPGEGAGCQQEQRRRRQHCAQLQDLVLAARQGPPLLYI